MSMAKISIDLNDEKFYKFYNEELYKRYIQEELEKSKAEAADPNTVWFSHEEVMSSLREHREA